MNYDFIYIDESYILKYIIEPNKIIYFSDIIDSKLHCTDNLRMATSFSSRKAAMFSQDKIKTIFGLEFQIEKEE